MVATFLSNFARAQRQPVDRWSVGVILLCALILGPVLAVLVAAFGDSGGLWPHLYDTVLSRYISNTLILMAGVGVVAIGFGVSSAWVISRYDFAGRRILEWMLLLPAAIPAYIIAYSYTEFFNMLAHFNRGFVFCLAGKVRAITGFLKSALLVVPFWLWLRFYIPISLW